MSSPVKPRRPYDASRRQEQARRSRWAMLQAAHRLFLERGHAGTPMPAVAAAAGVSVQGVYKAFGNKAALLKGVFDVAMAGDDEPLPMLRRAALGRARDEPAPRRKRRLYGEFVAEVAPRHVPVQLLARAAAATDSEAAEVWEQLRDERLASMAMFASALGAEGHLRPGVAVQEARDLLWACNSPEAFDLLVLQRGWTPQRYGRWLADTLIAALLP